MDFDAQKPPLNPMEYEKVPVIVDYVPRRANQNKYAFQLSDETASQVAGSTLPLVSIPHNIGDECDFDPFAHRKLTHPTTDSETLIHLLKGSLGSGILAMPMAFAHSGLWFGLFATIAIGVICTYCVHILVKCSQILCRRSRMPSLAFSDIAETAFLAGPTCLHKWSRCARFIISSFLVIDLIGCCCVYIVFVATNVKQLVDHYYPTADGGVDVRVVMLCILFPLLLLNMIRKLKYLAPISMIANFLMAAGIGITMYYILQDLPKPSERPSVITDLEKWPVFFGTVIFALEGIGVVMSLENNMENPGHFIGCPGVLNTGMAFVVILYAIVGFLGYLKYGEETAASITLNIPVDSVPAQCVKLMIATAIFLTYALQFYVPMEIIWKSVCGKFSTHKTLAENALRISLVILTVLIAVAIPNLGPFISLIGAVCLSTLGLIFPSIIELVTYWERPGLGAYNWRLWKNCALILFGILGFLTGTFVSILEIKAEHQ